MTEHTGDTESMVPPERGFPVACHTARREHLMSEIADQPRWLPRRRRWLTAAAAGLIVAGGGTATASIVWGGGGAPNTTTFSCYPEARRLHSDEATVGGSFLDDPKSPEKQCADMWENGQVKEGIREKPPLVTCLDNAGKAAVLPGRQGTCRKVGFRPLGEASEDERHDAIALRKVLASGPFPGCPTEKEAMRIIERKLDAHGLHDWEVKPSNWGEPGPRCFDQVGGWVETMKIITPGASEKYYPTPTGRPEEWPGGRDKN